MEKKEMKNFYDLEKADWFDEINEKCITPIKKNKYYTVCMKCCCGYELTKNEFQIFRKQWLKIQKSNILLDLCVHCTHKLVRQHKFRKKKKKDQKCKK